MAREKDQSVAARTAERKKDRESKSRIQRLDEQTAGKVMLRIDHKSTIWVLPERVAAARERYGILD